MFKEDIIEERIFLQLGENSEIIEKKYNFIAFKAIEGKGKIRDLDCKKEHSIFPENEIEKFPPIRIEGSRFILFADKDNLIVDILHANFDLDIFSAKRNKL